MQRCISLHMPWCTAILSFRRALQWPKNALDIPRSRAIPDGDFTQSTFVILLRAPFLEVRSTRKLVSVALDKVTLGSHTNSFAFPVFTKVRPTVALSLQKLGSEGVMSRNLEPGRHQMGPSFEYLTHGAAMSLARGCPGDSDDISLGRRLVHLASISVVLPLSAHLSAISLQNSPLRDLILTKCVKRPGSILFLKSSRISRRMSPLWKCSDSWIDPFTDLFPDRHKEAF